MRTSLSSSKVKSSTRRVIKPVYVIPSTGFRLARAVLEGETGEEEEEAAEEEEAEVGDEDADKDDDDDTEDARILVTLDAGAPSWQEMTSVASSGTTDADLVPESDFASVLATSMHFASLRFFDSRSFLSDAPPWPSRDGKRTANFECRDLL